MKETIGKRKGTGKMNLSNSLHPFPLFPCLSSFSHKAISRLSFNAPVILRPFSLAHVLTLKNNSIFPLQFSARYAMMLSLKGKKDSPSMTEKNKRVL